MATRNKVGHEIEEEPTSQASYLMSASCRIQDLADIYINPEESISSDTESACFQNYFNNETPSKYPNAPHSSPIDSQKDSDSPVFNEELVKCLNQLPVILLSFEERTKDGSTEITEGDTEDPSKTYFETSTFTDTDDGKGFQYQNGNISKSCSLKLDNLSWESKTKPTDPFPTNIVNKLEKFNFLRVDSLGEYNTAFCKSTLSDNTSMIANCASDASDISLEDIESVSSDDDSSCATRDRIEFEALALDTIYPSTIQRFQHWRTRGRNKRALSLDEMNPSKILHTTDFSAALFELNI